MTYARAHLLIERERGKAAAHRCRCSRQAEEWSYVGGSPDELKDEKGLRYSPNPLFYEPRCRPCHRAYDRVIRHPETCGPCEECAAYLKERGMSLERYCVPGPCNAFCAPESPVQPVALTGARPAAEWPV